jgi:peptide/nickel transport system substrate-binding protein
MASAQPPTVRQLLKRHRIAAGLTQAELAERSGVSERTISDMERGLRRAPYRDTVARLAEALALPPAERARFEASARGRDDGVAPMTAGGPAPRELAAEHQLGAAAVPPPEHETPPARPGRPTAVRPAMALTSSPKPSVPLRKWTRYLRGMAAAVLAGLLVVLSTGALGVQRRPTTPVPVRGGTWTVDLQKDPGSLIPNGDGDAFASSELVDQALYLPLFYGDAHGEIHPGAAREIPTPHNGEVNADGTVWTFRLRPGLVWSDGRPYDARDVDYTWRLWADPAFLGGFQLVNSRVPYQLIRSASVSPDHLSITFRLARPYAPFLAAWVDGVQAPLPAHHFGSMAPGQVLASPDELHPTVTSGPFLLSDSEPGDHYTLVRNARYYLAGAGLPYLDQLVFRVGSDAAVLADFQAGNVDVTQLDRTDVRAYQRLRGYRLVVAPTSPNIEALAFNLHNVVLATHPEVREAIARAIDQQALIRGPLLGFASPLCTDHPSALHPGYQPSAYCPAFGPAAANKVLDYAGWVRGADGVRARDGQRLEFEYATTAESDPNSWRTAVQLVVQRDLMAIGVKLDIEDYPGHQFFNAILPGGEPSPPTGAVAGRFDIAEYGWVYGYDADDSVLLACDQTPPAGANYGAYCNPALDALFQQELATPDAGLRQNLFDQIHQIEVTDMPFVVLFSPLIVTVVRDGTHNYAPSPFIGETSDVWEWWCDQGKC